MNRSSVAFVVVAALASLSARAQDGVGDGAHVTDDAEAPQDDAGALSDLQMGTFRVGAASPQGKRLGVGLQVGYATGVTAKLMLRPEHAVAVGIGAFTGLALTEPALSFHAGYLWHPFTIARSPAWALHTHVGGGGGVVILPVAGKRTTIPAALWYRGPTQLWTSLRAPIGVDLALTAVPVDVVLEAAPTVMVFPGLGVGCDLSVGARVWW